MNVTAMNIYCERLQDQYSDYFEHVLPAAEVEKFERHLASCESCRADYHTFATMFQFLDRIEVAEVDAPTGLRADILGVIAQRPVAKAFVLRDWLTGLFGRPQMLWGASLTAIACLVIAVVVGINGGHSRTELSTTAEESSLGGENSPIGAPAQSPLLQNVVLKEGTDNMNYEVFTLHTPSSLNSAASVSAYVLQDGGPVADATMENDTDKASPAWSGSLEPNVSLSLPVSVTSDVPAGTSLNLLLDWTAQDGSAAGREVAFVPITAASSTTSPVAAGSSFYDAVRTIAGEYQQTIVADNSALSAVPTAPPLSGTTGDELNAEQALRSVLSPDGFNISVQPGGYYLISHP